MGVGPSLLNYGVPDALRNPVMQLYAGANVIAANNDCVGYTAIVSGMGVTTGGGKILASRAQHDGRRASYRKE